MSIAASCAWWRSGLTTGIAALAACTASAEDVRPPADQLFFPSGIVVSPDESVLFVANANSELRYDSGSIGVINLDAVRQVVDDWTTQGAVSSGCQTDPDHRETLICDEANLMRPDAAVRIGNFATDIALQNFGADGLRLLVPSRGDPSISWADYDGDRLSCRRGTDVYELCDDEHRLTTVLGNSELPIPIEPFGVFADSVNGFAVVTHLSEGAVTLVDSSFGRSAQIVDVKRNVFAADLLSGIRAATGVAIRNQGTSNLVYVGSRTDDRIQTFAVGTLPDADAVQRPAYLLSGNYFFLDVVGSTTGQSNDTRNLVFSSSDRLYVVNRNPPSLQIYDTSNGPTGLPRNIPMGATAICPQASTVTTLDTEDGERAFVTCFQGGQVYVIDPRGQPQLEDIITVGRGPYSIAVAKERKLLFVSNFLEDTVAVIDVAPDSPNRNRVVLRIGTPRVP
jgi:DNA-binding beta-propeller fold protein YncE